MTENNLYAFLALCATIILVTLFGSIAYNSTEKTRIMVNKGLIECYQPFGPNNWTTPDACSTNRR